MRPRLYHRLRVLEETRARARNLAEGADRAAGLERALARFRLFLRMRGIDQGSNESLAEASARVLEISCSDLRKQLAGGIDPIHKFLTDREFSKRGKEKKPPDMDQRLDVNRRMSDFDGIASLAVLALRGHDGQAHLLSDRAGQEPAKGMRLPAGGFDAAPWPWRRPAV